MLSRFSRVQLCNPIDGSPPGSPVPGILQARTLECGPHVCLVCSCHTLGPKELSLLPSSRTPRGPRGLFPQQALPSLRCTQKQWILWALALFLSHRGKG